LTTLRVESVRAIGAARAFDSKQDRPDFERTLNEAVGASLEGDVELTETEKRFDALVAERRAKGRETYGTGLDHRASYDWAMMALEEALDLSQYLMARVVELEQAIEGHER
jgi:hypothetical protein